jgi:hypothetical protein
MPHNPSATRQQRRFEARKGVLVVGFTPVPRTRVRPSQLMEKAPQRFEPTENGGYRTYHPTKGWRAVSPKRLRNFPGAVA